MSDVLAMITLWVLKQYLSPIVPSFCLRLLSIFSGSKLRMTLRDRILTICGLFLVWQTLVFLLHIIVGSFALLAFRLSTGFCLLAGN